MKQQHIADPVVEKDLVLVYVEDKPAFFARVEGFKPDYKPKWWQVKLLVLQVPPALVTWILRREQINGEPFTMGGTPLRIEKVRVPEEVADTDADQPQPEKPSRDTVTPRKKTPEKSTGKARILSLGNKPGQK